MHAQDWKFAALDAARLAECAGAADVAMNISHILATAENVSPSQSLAPNELAAIWQQQKTHAHYL